MLFVGLGASFRFPHASGSGISSDSAHPLAIVAGCSGASKGGSSPCSLRCAWLRSRFAPLTRPALPAVLNAGRLRGMVLSVSPRNSRFFTTIILPISSRHIILCAPRSRLTHAPAPVLPPLIGVLRLTSPLQPLETSHWRGLPTPVSPKTTHTTTRRPPKKDASKTAATTTRIPCYPSRRYC